MRASLCLSLALALPALATAHDIVVFSEWQGSSLAVTVRYGHPGDWQPIAVDKLYRFDRVSASGSESWRKQLARDGIDLKTVQPVDDGFVLLVGQYDNGYWTKNNAGETVNTSRLTHPTSPMASHNVKFAKALAARDGAAHAGYDRIVGQRLELVPQADPLSLKPGDTLPVLVRFNSKPLANAGVEIGDSVTALPEDKIPRYPTDAKGIARVPIAKSGWAVVGVDHEEVSPTPQLAKREKYTATLVFSVR